MECANCGGAWLCASCSPVAVYSADPKPDRAARIRALANEWSKARHSSRPEVVWQDASEWVDALDRLEAQERQWIWRELIGVELIEEGGE